MAASENTFQERLDRIEGLIHQIQAANDQAVQSSAEELVEVLLDLHRMGLERVLEIVWETGNDGERIIHERLPEDELVNSLLILHGLHPLSLEARVHRALETVRPYMDSHGGGVELLGIEDGVVRLALQGSCGSCPSSTVTLKYAVEDAIYEAAPEIMDVQAVEQSDGSREPGDSFIPLDVLSNGKASASGPAGNRKGQWFEVHGLSALEEETVLTRDVDGRSVLFCRVGETLYAYRNTCARCHQTLDEARIEETTLHCPHCKQTFDVVRAGGALGAAAGPIKPIPLLEEEGRVRIALSESAVPNGPPR